VQTFDAFVADLEAQVKQLQAKHEENKVARQKEKMKRSVARDLSKYQSLVQARLRHQ
jgi:hypothetical protein